MENDAKPTDYLPRTYYYAEEMFDQERARIWEKCWQLLCRQEDLAEPSSYLCASIGKCPVVVLKAA